MFVHSLEGAAYIIYMKSDNIIFFCKSVELKICSVLFFYRFFIGDYLFISRNSFILEKVRVPFSRLQMFILSTFAKYSTRKSSPLH